MQQSVNEFVLWAGPGAFDPPGAYARTWPRRPARVVQVLNGSTPMTSIEESPLMIRLPGQWVLRKASAGAPPSAQELAERRAFAHGSLKPLQCCLNGWEDHPKSPTVGAMAYTRCAPAGHPGPRGRRHAHDRVVAREVPRVRAVDGHEPRAGDVVRGKTLLRERRGALAAGDEARDGEVARVVRVLRELEAQGPRRPQRHVDVARGAAALEPRQVADVRQVQRPPERRPGRDEERVDGLEQVAALVDDEVP